MIPNTNNKLLVTEDWKKIYQSFRNADFKSYDFETLRRSMIAYLQENYPEDFNDFIDSSEYIALIDLIAFLGQNLSFRIELNARENFLETAQRRDSILRLAELISYIPKRNVPANGLLKITSISTTDTVIDSNGINLANSYVTWNDSSNLNWYQQFLTILNSAMLGSFSFGKPNDRKVINGILTEQYRINSSNTDVPIFSFSKNVNGINMDFEIVPASISNSTSIYEEDPRPRNTFSLLFRNDNQGSGSSNTGFFTMFKQGTLGLTSFTLDTPVPNEIVGINISNINDTDIWLWQLDSNQNYDTLWKKVPAVTGNNIIYNSLNKNERKIYSISSRDLDQIDLNFADGSFGDLPKGSFRIFYRQSNGLTYVIKPEQMSGIQIEIPYFNKNGQSHTLTMIMSLQYIVNNSSGPESNENIQNKAPQSYYVQNRMITAEDYNIAPLTLANDILKVKSVNRISSGISKYYDLNDSTGKFGSTNIFGADGILYKDQKENSFNFEYTNRNEIYDVLKNKISPIISSKEMRSFYIENYEKIDLASLNVTWKQVIKTSKESNGYFEDLSAVPSPVNVGLFGINNLKYITADSLVKFVPPKTNSGLDQYFSANGRIVQKQSSTTRNYIWAKVVQVIGDGSNTGEGVLEDGSGPIKLSEVIPTGAIPTLVIPKFVNSLSLAFENEMVNLCLTQRNFGLTFNKTSRSWNIILDTNIDLVSPFNLTFQGNIDNRNKDASWIIAFVWNGLSYTVRYRLLEFIFESEKETTFFIDEQNNNYDYINNIIVKDKIDVLSFNTAVSPLISANTSTLGSIGKDYSWQIDGNIIETDGFVNPNKIKISFYDFNNYGQILDPDSFNNIVEPLTTSTETSFRDKFIYFRKMSDGLRYELVDDEEILAYPTPDQIVGIPSTSSLYYFYDPSLNVVKSYDPLLTNSSDPWIFESDYYAYPGRSGLKFHYVHNSSDDRRIDPSKSNIIDVYLLTSTYDREYRNWLSSGQGIEPLAPTTQSLEQNYSAALEPIKAISDEIIFNPVKYKVLFGDKADTNLRAVFKAVRNPAKPISDNEIKTRIINAIEEFFNLDNWDFGQTFYFSELSTYVMNLLTPDILNFIIVPKGSGSFGSLYEISCLSNEIFVNGASVFDVEVIDAITASQLKTTSIITSSGTNNG
jgi:hypothetical protein